MKRTFEYLRNGGLNPTEADPIVLRQRRTLATASMLLLPIGALMTVINAGLADYFDATAVAIATLMAGAAIVLQAKTGRTEAAAHLLASAVFFGSAFAMLHHGFNGNAWIWLFVTPGVGTLLGGRRAGLVWTGISLGSLWAVGAAHGVGYFHDWGGRTLLRVVEASFCLVIIGVTLQAFRAAQKRAEDEQGVAIRQLERQVHERTQLERTAREAEARALKVADAALQGETAKATFLATMSHEIRTPMNGVLGAAQLLSETPLNQDQSMLLDTVEASAETLLALIGDVLDYSRLEARSMQLEAVPFDLRQLLHRGSAPVRLAAEAKALQFTVTVDDDVSDWMIGDPTRLRQILLNLCSNAVKFTESGEVSVRATAYPDGIHLRIHDTGIGMRAEVLSTLWDPFVQAEASTTRRFGGSGLGLAIVHRLIGAMNGHIEVHSTEGVGTVFELDLPLIPCSSPTDVIAADSVDNITHALRILVVDDNAVNRMVAARMLERDGHTIIEAEHGQHALDLLGESIVDLVFMDVQMPVVDGYDATRAIRTMPSPLCDIPVVGLTANALPGDHARVIDAGMNDYLAKPVRQDKLRQAVHRWCGSQQVSATERSSPSGI